MTVGKLKKLLNRLPNDIEILIDTGDDLTPLCNKTNMEVLPLGKTPDDIEEVQVLIFNVCYCGVDENNEEEEKIKMN